MKRRNKKIWRKRAIGKTAKNQSTKPENSQFRMDCEARLPTAHISNNTEVGVVSKTRWGEVFSLLRTIQTSPGASLQWLPGLFPES